MVEAGTARRNPICAILPADCASAWLIMARRIAMSSQRMLLFMAVVVVVAMDMPQFNANENRYFFRCRIAETVANRFTTDLIHSKQVTAKSPEIFAEDSP